VLLQFNHAAGWLQVAADPNTLYPLLIDSPAVATLAGLLSHDNTDIAVEVMDLLQELTDAGGGGGGQEDVLTGEQGAEVGGPGRHSN
jgi:beta-catenin-like protein 1